ncbi:hypothetical protein MKZ38_003483 [Zalerion maritima]|uniref:Uncharacterized protein n=1 Tax=Zalerion maritima TaxID=339359 RepID=A0AAD5RYV4_9PEZI|nr:hypothetical protein MKZ38_003483 [Zalerion maritima]
MLGKVTTICGGPVVSSLENAGKVTGRHLQPWLRAAVTRGPEHFNRYLASAYRILLHPQPEPSTMHARSGPIIIATIAALCFPYYHLNMVGRPAAVSYFDTRKSFTAVKDGPLAAPVDDQGQKQRKKRRRLFNLVHPLNAKHRTDKPAYFATANSLDLPGNVRLEVSRKSVVLRRTEFRALLSPNRTASSTELFDEEKARELFCRTKSKIAGGAFTWTRGSDGKEVAREENGNGNGNGHGKGCGKGRNSKSLAVSAPVARETRDTLVALWVLRLWHGIAEDGNFTRKSLEDMTRAEPAVYGDTTLAKRTATAGVLAAGASC